MSGTSSRPGRGIPALLRTALPIAVSILILMLLYRKIDSRSLLGSLNSIDPAWSAIYVLLACFEPLVRSLRWASLIGEGRFAVIAGGMYTGKACNNLFPLRMGDAVRVQYIRDKAGVQYRKGMASLLGETVLDIAFLSVLGILFASMAASRHRDVLTIAITSLAAIVAALAALLIVSRRIQARRGPIGILHVLSSQVRAMITGHRLHKVLAATLLLWGYTVLTAYCGLRILLPSVTAEGVLGSIVLVYFAAFIPSAPGFIGSYHAAVAASLAIMGYSFQEHSSLPIVVHAFQFVPQVLIGLAVGLRYIHGNDWRRAFTDFNAARKRLLKGSE